jgi:hypothetical protein
MPASIGIGPSVTNDFVASLHAPNATIDGQTVDLFASAPAPLGAQAAPPDTVL